MTLPQLRVRTEFSFKQTFGPIPKIAARLIELNATAAGIVDSGTWGHVRWAKALAETTVKPLFGTELEVVSADGMRPKAWALARSVPEFYRFSTAARKEGAKIPELFAEHAAGLIRFAGAALTDPEQFDYVDLNPSSLLQQRRSIALAQRTGKPLVITSDNVYPARDDYAAFMAIVAREKLTPQWILTQEELRASIKLDDEAFAAAVRNTHEVAEMAASKLNVAPLIRFDGDLRALAAAGKEYRLQRGHIRQWTDEYEVRLQREIEIIEFKEFQSYFLVVADLVQWAKERMLVGPARGSSAGSLICYLLRITEVDPLVHELLFERFIDLTRKDLPDIDIDFSDTKRDLCFTYLAEKYGADCVSRIGNVNTLKPISVLNKVGKQLGIPIEETFPLRNVMIEYSSGDSRYGKGLEDTLESTEYGRFFIEKYPEARVLTVVENHASHSGVHAAGVIVSNVPVIDFCTVNADGVAQIDKPDAEYLNLLKIDALGLRTLGVIEDANVVTADELYSLPLDDPATFAIFNAKKYSGIFQFEGQAQRSVAAQVVVDRFKTIDHVTALARPGPLGGGAANHYIRRHNGEEQFATTHPSMEDILRDTYGVVLYQEQVMRIVREIGKFSWEDTTVIRKAMSGRKGKEFFDRQGEKFIAGAAVDGIDAGTAHDIWEEICNFGAWGMNKSHTCAYGIISYWCAWMKAHHPLAYAAACLRNARDDAQTGEILRELLAEGVQYIPFDIERSEIDWSVQDGVLVGGFKNLEGFGPAKSTEAVEARAQGKMTDKLREKIAKATVKFSDLYPLKTAYQHLYDDPVGQLNARDGSKILLADQLPEAGDVLWLGKVVGKKKRDQFEAVLIARRRGRALWKPEFRYFVDLNCIDDTDIPVIVRIDRMDYQELGEAAINGLIAGQDVIVVRGERIRNFPMIKVNKIRCITNPEVFA